MLATENREWGVFYLLGERRLGPLWFASTFARPKGENFDCTILRGKHKTNILDSRALLSHMARPNIQEETREGEWICSCILTASGPSQVPGCDVTAHGSVQAPLSRERPGIRLSKVPEKFPNFFRNTLFPQQMLLAHTNRETMLLKHFT